MQQQRMRPILDGSPLALLYERDALTIFTYIVRRVSVREDAEDILLEVFLAALEQETLADLHAEKQRAWLLRVAHNKVIDHLRYQQRRSIVPLETVSETLYAHEENEPDVLLLAQEEYAQLRSHVEQLPALQQEVIRLRFSAGLHYHEIARLLNKREGAVRVLLSRALGLLRTIYRRSREDRTV
ncbi:MAG TPA: sigma-70 family RNA polymerase sigma factor [Ktedonobacteraceae bacterium]|jgi:RNA polymerase sigma factor (sigma-70 family)|nr:sigma-70 family RNA polymerase sigma factor [Ktedonobacteraceae bacterium]